MNRSMHVRRFFWITLVVLTGILFPRQLRAQSHDSYIFTRVNVIPMDRDTVLLDQSVVVQRGLIRQIGPSADISPPDGAFAIDGKGKYLMPSLADMHVHLEGDAWNIMFPEGAKFAAADMHFEDILFLYVAHGIATVDVLSALPEHIGLRERIRRNEIIGPRMILSRMLDATGKAWPPPLCTWISNADEARTAVTDIHRQGYDRIKVYSFLDVASYDTIMAVAGELNMPVDGHMPDVVPSEHVLASGQGMIAHVEEFMKRARSYDADEVRQVASQAAKSGIRVTSSLVLNKNLNALLRDSVYEFTKPGTEFLHPMASGIWEFIYQYRYRNFPDAVRRDLADAYERFQKPFVREFVASGGKLLAGTDALVPTTIPALSLHDEVQELVAAGLRPYDALRSATVNVAEFLGEEHSTGTLRPGTIANLIILEANPLDDITATRAIAGVMTQGRWLPKGDIERRLSEIRNSYAALRTKKGPDAAR